MKLRKTTQRLQRQKATRFQRQYELMRVYASAPPKLRRAITRNASNDFIRALIDVSVNLLRGNIKNIPRKLFHSLYKHKSQFRRIAVCCNKRGGITAARRHLSNQKGGFLSVLIPLITTVASSLIGGLINRGK